MQTPRPNPQIILLILLCLLPLTACQVEPERSDSFVVADLFATPGKAIATIELSPTPIPSPTIPNFPSPTAEPTLPLPTVVVLQQPTLPIGTLETTQIAVSTGFPTLTPTIFVCPTAVQMPFSPVWQNFPEVQDMLGCPTSDVFEVSGVFQFFEHGLMLWRANDRSIFALSDLAIRQGQATDSWWRLDDTFEDGEPEIDSGLDAPSGLIQPARGFGKVWRDNGFIREGLGWATHEEIGATSLWLSFEKGWMMAGPDGLPIYVMIPLDEPPYSSGIHTGPLP